VTRVLVIASDPLARAGLAGLLADSPGLVVVGRAGEAELADAVQVHRPAIIVWDTGWQAAESLERLAQYNDEDAPVLVLLGDESLAGQAWRAGIRGLLSRSASAEQIAVAAAALEAGLFVISPEFARAMRSAPLSAVTPPAGATPSIAEPLTPRELEVLRLVADGLPNKTIASRLNISEHTVKFHVNALLGKLGAASRTEAVVTATRLGLILL
jgi:two-component system, NarL family, nitrate/nitrite response regulator NarL